MALRRRNNMLANAGMWSLAAAALIVLLSIAPMLGLDRLLRLLFVQARPSPELISVVEPGMKGLVFPSTFALVYVGTLGYLAVVSLARTKGWIDMVVALACIAARPGTGSTSCSRGTLAKRCIGFVSLWIRMGGVLLYWIPARDQRAG